MKADKGAHLNLQEVWDIAAHLADRYGFPRPDPAVFRQNARGKVPQPYLLANEKGSLWVDVYYVAYQLSGEADVRYVYITSRHIDEETASYRAAGKAREIAVHLPSDIERQFRTARRQMKENDEQFWIDLKESSSILNREK